MRAKVLIAAAVVAALTLPFGAAAQPKPAGCAGVVQVTGSSCTFVLEAGNDGAIEYGFLVLVNGTGVGRLDVLRGSTVVASSGNDAGGPIIGSGQFTVDDTPTPLAAGTYRCRLTATGPVVVSAFACAIY